jgi:hypothetical protein
MAVSERFRIFPFASRCKTLTWRGFKMVKFGKEERDICIKLEGKLHWHWGTSMKENIYIKNNAVAILFHDTDSLKEFQNDKRKT